MHFETEKETTFGYVFTFVKDNDLLKVVLCSAELIQWRKSTFSKVNAD